MHTANLTIYPEGEVFERFFQLDYQQCLGLLIPYLDRCREIGRISARVADMDFEDGLVVWFGSDEGTIDLHQGRFWFGRRVKWQPLFSLPMRKQTALAVDEQRIRGLLLSAYE